MKQHITPKQLNELSKKGVKRLFNWLTKKGYHDGLRFLLNDEAEGMRVALKKLPPLSIGQMIEFLQKHKFSIVKIHDKKREVSGWVVGQRDKDGQVVGLYNEELADGLWNDCKEILNEK